MIAHQSAVICLAVAAFVGTYRIGVNQEKLSAAQTVSPGAHVMVGPGTVKWTPRSNGISIAVMSGSPDTPGAPFVIRLKLADGTRVAPHWHPVDEHLTVLSGTFYMGVGEKFDEATAMALSTGTYAFMPKDVRHFGWTGVETVVQIHGVGPFKTYFVEPPSR